MNTLRRSPRISCSRRGFSLVELLVVLVIFSILTVALSGVAGVLKGTSLTQATSQLANYLRQGRQLAITSNKAIEVRFYQYADPTFAGEVQGAPATGRFRAVWLFQVDDNGNSTPAARPLLLPNGIILDKGVSGSSNSLSTLLDVTVNPIALANSGQPATDTAHPLLSITASQYIGFHFNRDGTTDIPLPSAINPNYITLHSVNDGDSLAAPPKNYATIRIETVNGAISVFRPNSGP